MEGNILKNKDLIIRGIKITDNEINEIKDLVHQYWQQGRTYISKEVCRLWNWRQPNGWLKDWACRELMLVLHRKGLITLPPSKTKTRTKSKRPQKQDFNIDTSFCEGPISDYKSLTLSMVRLSPKEKLWNYLVATYHYLGNPVIVGSHLKYLAYLDGQVVACIGWGSAAWKVGSRDSFIGWDQHTRKQNLHLVANNVRFLILPWVNIPHLASKIMAKNAKLLVKDWLDFYNVQLLLLETFVDSSRFKGTCYKAANWIHVGDTAGSAKSGTNYFYHGSSKAVFLYPVHKNFRKLLKTGRRL